VPEHCLSDQDNLGNGNCESFNARFDPRQSIPAKNRPTRFSHAKTRYRSIAKNRARSSPCSRLATCSWFEEGWWHEDEAARNRTFHRKTGAETATSGLFARTVQRKNAHAAISAKPGRQSDLP